MGVETHEGALGYVCWPVPGTKNPRRAEFPGGLRSLLGIPPALLRDTATVIFHPASEACPLFSSKQVEMTLIISNLDLGWQVSGFKIKDGTLKKYQTYKRKSLRLVLSRWMYYVTFYINGIYIKLTQYFQLLYSMVIKDMKNYMYQYHIFINNCTTLTIKVELYQRSWLYICLQTNIVQFSTYLWIPLYHVTLTLVLHVFKCLKCLRLLPYFQNNFH